MACITNQKANGSSSTTPVATTSTINETPSVIEPVAINKDWSKIGNLTDELIKIFKKYAKKDNHGGKYDIKWQWLAALAWVESNWRVNVKNELGYYGLFQFLDKNLNDGVKPGTYSLTNPEHQAKVAAKNMSARQKAAKDEGLSEDEAYMYAGIAHNCGRGGAYFLLDKASPKTIAQMVHIEKTLPAREFTYDFMASDKKRKEISEYPYKMRDAYKTICSKYK